MLELTRSTIKPEHVEEALRLIREPMNFFKHANRDPYVILEFNPALSEGFIGMSIAGLLALGEQRSDVQIAFHFWGMLHKPHWVMEGEDFLKNIFKPQEIADFKNVPKTQFLETVLLALTHHRLKRR